jgi:predicted RNA binding protein YcfA (HicA-like mRNA interferase family)
MGYSMKSREIIKRLQRDGWRLDRVTGDHHTFVKDGVDHLVTVPHPKRDLPIGTLRAIFRQAGWGWPPS